MPSTNKLYSRKSRKASRKTSGYIARFLYTFCGIFASFGVVTMLALVGTTTNASAVGNSSNSNTVSATLPGSVAIRLLDSTATSEISSLDFNLIPTASGTSATQSMVVDVATSNPTGYKLYMQSDYQIKDSQGTPTGNYTTNLTHTDPEVADNIPTSTSASTIYWNYINPLENSNNPSNPTPSVIPAYGHPDKIAELFSTTNSDQTTVPFNVSVDTTIVSGTYENELLFSAVGNPAPVAYTIDFDADGGSPEPAVISSSATSSTFSVTIDPTVPVKTGYTFSHWEITSVTSSSPNPDIAPEATCNNTNTCQPGDALVISSYGEAGVNVELTAVYTLNSHTVTITNNTGITSTTITCTTNGTPDSSNTGSSTNTTNTCDYGSTVTISATTSTGYSFDSSTGWVVDSGGATIINSQFTMPDSNVAITANATKMYTYTLNLNANDGTSSKQVLNYPSSGGTADTTHTFTDLNNQAPSRTGYTFLGWATSSTGTSYVTAHTLNSSSASTTPTTDGFPVTGDLYAIWQKNSYTVTVTNSNTTSGASSLSIPYGESKTVTVTPSSGYYLSAVSCPSGYTCSGYGTGTSYTGQQTVTVKNNNTTSGGTLAFTGTLVAPTSCATATPVNPGSAPTTNNMYTSGGKTYVKLYTNSTKTTSACWTKDIVTKNIVWPGTSYKDCPSGTALPSKDEFESLISAYGTGSDLHIATDWGNISNCTPWLGSMCAYWSSNSYDSTHAYDLRFSSNVASIHYFIKNNAAHDIICIVR